MIEQAFHAYTKAVEAMFELSRRPPTTKESKVEWLDKEAQLRHRVDQLEERPEFRALTRETLSAFRSDDWHSAKRESWWRDPVRQFFRRTGYYTDTFAGSDKPCDLFERYEAAFQRRSVQTKYLAPLEFVHFPKDSQLNFSGFEILKFDRNKLDKIVGNEVNRVFYPKAEVDTSILQEYWFIVVKTEEEVQRLGPLYYSAADVAAAEGRVYPEYTRFPPAIERVLARLVLFDWVGDPEDPSTYSGQNCYPFGFNIPFVIRVDDNDLGRPQSAPDCSKLITTPGGNEGEYEIPFVIFDLKKSRAAAFEQQIQRADECLRHLEKKKHDTKLPYLDTLDTRWPFLKVAMGNLIKAFFTEELEQLLWHFTALEALLSERGPGVTASLARKSAAILGKTKAERKERRKQFKGLYNLRSDLVHGRKFQNNVHRKPLFEARIMVLQVMIWFVHYLSEVSARINTGSWPGEVPKREDILILLNLSDADRTRLSVLLNNLPNGFPAAPDWSP